ncbi:unnamed protein product, partial [marine sediment metagenome]
MRLSRSVNYRREFYPEAPPVPKDLNVKIPACRQAGFAALRMTDAGFAMTKEYMTNMNTTHRPTWAEIKLDAIKHNCKEIRACLSKGAAIMAVVKANAYGHGILEVSRVLEKMKIAYLGVATLDEAVALRARRVKTP